jgi:hypothetical protein
MKHVVVHPAIGGRRGGQPLCLIVLLVLLFGGLARSGSAQPGFTVALGRAFNSVSDPAAPGATDSRQTTVATFEVEHLAAAERLRLFYTLDAGNYTTPGDWQYYLHTAGATWGVPVGSAKQHILYLSGSGSFRSNGASWAAADYRAAGLMANAELHPAPVVTVRLGYRLDVRDFPDLGEMDQVQHDGFGSVLIALPTRTTLISEAHLGTKRYADTFGMPASFQTAEMPAAPPGSGLMGRGVGPGLRGGSAAPSLQENRAGMVTWLARVAQSLTDRTGVSFQYAARTTFGRVSPVLVTTPALYFDDRVYDDPFASGARVISVAAKRVFAGGMELEAQASRSVKDYNAVVALDADGSGLPALELRADRIWRASAGWTVPIARSKSGPLALDLSIDYLFTRHRSNDAFYNYTTHTIGLGAKVSY